MADLSKLSTADLMALKAGDLSKVSSAGLTLLRASAAAAPAPAKRPIETPAFEREAAELVNTTGAELIAGAAPARFAMGAASPLLAALQIGANIVGGEAARDVNAWLQNLETMKRKGMKAMPNPYPQGISGDSGAVVDAVNASMNESDMIGMGGAVLNPVGLGVASALPRAATVGGRAGQGAAVGAGYGASQPVTNGGDDFWGDKAEQAGVGAAVGAAVPLGADLVRSTVVPVAKGVYHAVEPLLPGGTERVMARTLNQAAGDRAPQVVAELQAARQLVPGSRPTAGEAAVDAGSAEFSALQRIVSTVRPSDYAARGAEQEAARLGAIRSVGQTPQALKAAEQSRETVAGAMYENARFLGVDPIGAGVDPAVRRELQAVMRAPAVRDALKKARTLAANEGVNLKDEAGQLIGLDYTKRALDDQISNATGNEKRIILDLKNRLLATMDRLSPEYAQARQTFAQMSRPINQMEVGQYLEQALVAPLAGRERAASLAQAVRNAPQTLKRSTGFNRYEELADVLDPPQVAAVQGVVADLGRKADFNDLAKAGMPAAQKQVGSLSTETRLPNALHRPIMIANAILSRLQGKASEKTLNELAIRMQDPAEIARIMQAAPPHIRRIISEEAAALARNTSIATPAVVNAQEQ